MMIARVRIVEIAVFFCLLSASTSEAARNRVGFPVTIYVSPRGNDSNEGTASRPVRSAARALALLEDRRLEGAGKTEVVFATGRYTISRSLELKSIHSGAPGAPTVIRAAKGATVEFSGGVALHGWKWSSNGEIITKLDDTTFTDGCPEQFFAGGVRRGRPRAPVNGTFRTSGNLPNGTPTVSSLDFPENRQVGDAAQIVILDAWAAVRLPLIAVEGRSRALVFGSTFRGHGQARKVAVGTPFFIENLPVKRLSPGHWLCDASQHLIRYRPLDKERHHLPELVVPRISTLLRISGSTALPIHDIAIKGIHFLNSMWRMPRGGWSSMQAGVGLQAMIEVSNCDRVEINDIILKNTGASGLRIGAGCKNVQLIGSRFINIGGGGLMIGPEDRGVWPASGIPTIVDSNRMTSHILIEENSFLKLGRVQPDAAGIWLGQVDHVKIIGNRISDLYYSGISLGWAWDSLVRTAGYNTVAGNFISNYGQGLLSDFGGIYTLGAQPGTRIFGNSIRDGKAAVYGGYGIYADEGSSYMEIENNSISGTSDAEIFLHETGRLNLSRNLSNNGTKIRVRCSYPRVDTLVLLFGHGTARSSSQDGSACIPPHYIFR